MKRSLRSWLWRVDITQEVDEELEFHIEMRTRELVEPLDYSHLTLSLPPEVDARSYEPADITQPREHHLTRNPRVHASIDELSSTHLDMKFELLVHLLSDVDAP